MVVVVVVCCVRTMADSKHSGKKRGCPSNHDERSVMNIKRLSVWASVRQAVTELYEAMLRGAVEQAVGLLMRNPDQLDPCMANDCGDTPLTLSVRKGNLKMLQALLSIGCNPACTDYRHQKTPLLLAIESRRLDMVKALMLSKIKTPLERTDEGLESPLALAIKTQQLDIFNILLKAGANPNARDVLQRTALMCALKRGNSAPYVRALLAKGARVEDMDTNNLTAIGYACANRRLKSAKMLLEAKANVEHEYRPERTPLFISLEVATLRNKIVDDDMVKLLLSYGANVDSAMKHAAATSPGMHGFLRLFKRARTSLAKAAMLQRSPDVIEQIMRPLFSRSTMGFLARREAELCAMYSKGLLVQTARRIERNYRLEALQTLGLLEVFTEGVRGILFDYMGCCSWEDDIVLSLD